MPEDKQYSEDFRYVVRVINADLNGERYAHLAIQGIPGIGTRMADAVLAQSGLPPRKLLGDYTDEEVAELESAFNNIEDDVPTWMLNRRNDFDSGEDVHAMTQDLGLIVGDDLDRLKKIRSYRGIRHETKRKTRGQRTRSNGRKGLSLGVKRKK